MVRRARKLVCGTVYHVNRSKHLHQLKGVIVRMVSLEFTKILTVSQLKLKIVNVGYHPLVSNCMYAFTVNIYLIQKKIKFIRIVCDSERGVH